MKFNSYLSEHSEYIKSFCYIGGKFLISAPTGSGKTQTFLQIGKEILEETKNEFVFIFATPTRVQSEQNGSNYDVFTVVSGVNRLKEHKVNSIVYDKLKVALDQKHEFKNKKIILIVDEAHELIYSSKYRRKALDLIQELSSVAYTVIHTSATPKMLKYVFKYDETVSFEKQNPRVKNIKLILNNEPTKILTGLIYDNLKLGKKTIVNINDKNSISYLSQILKGIFKNKKISLFSSENKDDRDFKYLIENNKLPENVDLALCTNILNAGINIKNKDVELVYFAENGKWNLDLIQQFSGRTREENSTITLITKRAKEEFRSNKMKSLEDIFNDWFITLNKRYKTFTDLYLLNQKFAEDNGFDFSFENFEIFLKSVKYEDGKDKLNSCFDFSETELLKINKAKLIELATNYCDSQILHLHSTDDMVKILSKALTSKVELIEMPDTEEGEEIAKQLKRQEQNKKQETKELKNKIYQMFINAEQEDKDKFIELLELKIKNEDYIVIETFKQTLKDEFKELVDEIDAHHNMIDKLRQMYRTNVNINPHCLQHFISNKFKDKILIAIRYVFFNNNFKTLDNISNQDIRFLGQDYLTIRKTLEPYMRKNISYKQLAYLYNALNSPSKQVNSFKEISEKNMEKFLFKVGCVFNLVFTSERYFVSSLRK